MLRRFSIASRRRTMTPSLLMFRAPAESVTLTIAGRSSGERPTARATEKSSDSTIGRWSRRFTVRTERTMTTILDARVLNRTDTSWAIDDNVSRDEPEEIRSANAEDDMRRMRRGPVQSGDRAARQGTRDSDRGASRRPTAERRTGGLNASGFTLRVNGQDRTIPASDVAAVEFAGGSPTGRAQARIDDGQALIVLRSGQIIDGRLVDIGGTRPLRLTVDTPSGRREYMSNDVAQIYLYAAPRAAASAGPPAQAEAAVDAIFVQGNQPWTDSGFSVKKGQSVAFSGRGDIMIAANASSGVGGSPAATSPLIRYPLPGTPVGALIARIGKGKPFAIGANTQPMAMTATGQLFLGVNDEHFEDNTGTYTVTLKR